MSVAWSDLIKLGVIKSNFLEVTTDEFVSRKTVSKEEPTDDADLAALKKKYSDVFSETLEGGRKMKGDPIHIYLREDPRMRPCHSMSARPLPLAWQQSATKLVQSLLKSEVIVPVSKPLPWCSPAHFVKKPGLQWDYQVLQTNFAGEQTSASRDARVQ